MSGDLHSADQAGETRALTAPREFAFHKFRCEVIAGPDKGAHQVSDAPEFVLGTAEGNQLVLTDRTVSRHHCVITATPQGFMIRDLGSTNGTLLGGFRIESAYLKPGATIGIGKTNVRFDSLPETIREPLSEEGRYGRVLGESMAMRRIFAILARVAGSESTLLLEGETGTGKGLLAEAVHQQSPRAGGPFVVVDCSSIPSTLLEAELFGYAKGAFTGAYMARPGVFEAANGGTVFLDEIGELPIEMQPKLLRVIEDRMIRRLGTAMPLQLDVRLIAATNRDLRQEVNRGTFRSDLFYRLNIVRVRLPPLRERREDVPLLVTHFYKHFTKNEDGKAPAELLTALLRQDWPGNVRELRSAVERAVLMEDPELWREAVVGVPMAREEGAPAATTEEMFDPALSFREAKEQAVARWERAYLQALIRASDGNLSRAARAARMNRNHLRELLRHHHVQVREE
jgi:transcriptional regulator with GAF, ATPase, and Fis domain